MCPDLDIQNIAHPCPAKKVIPSWFAKMSKYLDEKSVNFLNYSQDKAKSLVISRNQSPVTLSTVKTCVPVQDMLTSGYIIPVIADMVAEINKEAGIHNFSWKYPGDFISTHPPEQFPDSPIEKATEGRAALKYNNSWQIVTPPGYSTLYLPPPYRENKITILPAIVDTDKHHSVNFPFIWTGPEGDVVIDKGEPVALAIPFKREAWKHEIVGVPQDQLHQQDRKFHSRLFSIYRKERWTKKHFD